MVTTSTRPDIVVDQDTLYELRKRADKLDIPRSRVYGIAMEIGVANEEELENRLDSYED